MAGSIAEAMMAARNVDQRAVQGNTNAIRKMSLNAGTSDGDAGDQRDYALYQRQMQQDGRRPISFKQWQMMYRHNR